MREQIVQVILNSQQAAMAKTHERLDQIQADLRKAQEQESAPEA